MFTAFLDACVLVPIALSDTLLRTAEQGLFRPCWSPIVLAEVRAALMAVHPDLAPARIDHRLRMINRAFPDASIGVEHAMVGELYLPDPDDRHVLAAALKAHADVTVTANLRDFPEQALLPLGLAAVGPDDFLLDQLDLSAAAMLAVIEAQAQAARHPPLEVEDVLIALGLAGAPSFACKMRALRARQEDETHPSPTHTIE